MIHQIPHKCTKGLGLLDCMNPQQEYYYYQSLKRYQQRPDANPMPVFRGEVGQISPFRIITSDMAVMMTEREVESYERWTSINKALNEW